MAVSLYTTIGQALMETLRNAVDEGMITESLAFKMRKEFECAIWEALRKKARIKVSMHGSRLAGSRHIEGQWTLIKRNVNVKVGYRRPFVIDKLKIIALPRMKAGEVPEVIPLPF